MALPRPRLDSYIAGLPPTLENHLHQENFRVAENFFWRNKKYITQRANRLLFAVNFVNRRFRPFSPVFAKIVINRYKSI